ncbi:MAG: tetratricopeptide repeat protein [candidate division WOR-3 bacterium]
MNKKIIIITAITIITVITVIKLSWKKNPPVIISPLGEELSQAENNFDSKSVSYYITTSQEILTKAQELAETTSTNGRQQTPEEKQKIIELINHALDFINQGIAVYPTDDRVFAQRAKIYQALIPLLPESFRLAIQDLKEAIKLKPENPNYHLQLANLYLKGGDFAGAASCFYNAYVLEPTNQQILYILADSLEKSGQLAKAQYYFEKLQSLLPTSDQNQTIIKSRIETIKTAIQKANLKYLSLPGEINNPVPAGSSRDQELLGTQDLPIEEASLKQNVIIAGNEEEKGKTTNQLTINALSGEGEILPGEKEIIIYNNNLKPNQQILIIPQENKENRLIYLKAQKPAIKECLPEQLNPETCGWFKVGLDQTTQNTVKFKWFIISLQQ